MHPAFYSQVQVAPFSEPCPCPCIYFHRMCCILAYLIFVPIAKELAARLDNPYISTATALALGAVASFNLVYPSPVIISAAEELSANADKLLILGFLISVPTSIPGYLYARRGKD